jgi:hypothetical protein
VWQLQAQHQRVDQSTTDRDGEFVSRATLHPARALAAAVVTPFVAVNIFEGTKAMDKSRIVMALTFKARQYLLLHKVYIPQLLPYIYSAYSYGFRAIWQIVNSASVILRSVSASSTPRCRNFMILHATHIGTADDFDAARAHMFDVVQSVPPAVSQKPQLPPLDDQRAKIK